MRIISKKHDYYDKVMIYGADATVIFNRKLVEYHKADDFSPDIEKHFRETFGLLRGKRLDLEAFAVIFCGMIHKGIRIETEERSGFGWVKGYNKTYCFNAKETIKFLENNKIDVEKDFEKRTYTNGKFVKAPVKRRIEMFFEDSGSDKFMNLMIEKRCSILLVERTDYYGDSLKVTENPVLKKVGFFRAVDPYTAYQQLSMFVGGILPKKEKPIIKISDKDMIIKKGFDKWSFRKMKGD